MKLVTTTIEEVQTRQIEYNNKVHHVRELTNTGHIITVCGISTWTDNRPLIDDEVTCQNCIQTQFVSFDKDIIIRDEKGVELYTAHSFKDARAWCYNHGAHGFTIRNKKFSTRIVIS